MNVQSGEARASIGSAGGQEEQQELAAVLDAGAAKSLAQQLLARRWARRDLLTLRLPPNRMGIEPGTTIELELSPSRWVVEQSKIDGMAVVVELRPAGRLAVPMQATAARILASQDLLRDVVRAVGPLTVLRGAPVAGKSTPADEELVTLAVKQLSKELSTEIVAKSSIVAVRYVNARPLAAKQVLDQLLASYLAKHIDVYKTPGSYEATGKLTIRDVTREIHVPFTYTAVTEAGKPAAWIKGETKIQRLDFGVGGGDWADTSTIPNEVAISTKVVLKPR